MNRSVRCYGYTMSVRVRARKDTTVGINCLVIISRNDISLS